MKITYNPVNGYYDEVIKKNREEIKKCMTCPICGNRVNNLDNGLETGIIPYKGNQLHYNPNDDIYKILGDIFINKTNGNAGTGLRCRFFFGGDKMS